MKKLNFLIIALAALAVQGIYAVTLPSNSYTPYALSDESYGGVGIGETKFSPLKFESLGDNDWGDACLREHSGSKDLYGCQDCCNQYLIKECGTYGDDCDTDEYNTYRDKALECRNQCGRSLPIDGGEWALVILAAISFVCKNVTVIRCKC